MSRIVVHIGPHKTGTSALQTFLQTNKNALFEQGVLYETFGSVWKNHHALASAFITGENMHPKGMQSLRKMIEIADGRTILISSEVFCEPRLDKDLFLSSLEDHQIEIIGYLRHPCDQLLSSFNQVVRSPKRRWTRPVNEKPYAYDPSAYSMLRRWLIPDACTLAPYDPPQWRGGSIFGDFLSMLNVDTNGMQIDDEPENTSIPFPIVEVLRELNVQGFDEPTRERVLDVLTSAQSEELPYPLDKETVAECYRTMTTALVAYRPFLRQGFDDRFLFEPRGQGEDIEQS